MLIKLTGDKLNTCKCHESMFSAVLVADPPASDTAQASTGQEARLNDAGQVVPVAQQTPLGDDRLADQTHVKLPRCARHQLLDAVCQKIRHIERIEGFVRCTANRAAVVGLRQVAPHLDGNRSQVIGSRTPEVFVGSLQLDVN